MVLGHPGGLAGAQQRIGIPQKFFGGHGHTGEKRQGRVPASDGHSFLGHDVAPHERGGRIGREERPGPFTKRFLTAAKDFQHFELHPQAINREGPCKQGLGGVQHDQVIAVRVQKRSGDIVRNEGAGNHLHVLEGLRVALENLDQVIITHRYGVLLDEPLVYNVIETPREGPSGITVRVELVTNG